MSIAVVVETQYGKLEGELRGAHSVFRGIPFARPPLGALRFTAPEPPEPWTGVRSARAFGASSLQGAVFAPGVLAEGPLSEDCLYLNVYTPRADSQKRPVLFFIHGGAFTVGSASAALYDAARLAEHHDVVVVTANYRVGALGYLALGEAGRRWGAVDNRGQLDQLAALRWVSGNIESFGGDANNVTIFGESAGATAVCLLLATPSARGLFKRAISQSAPGALDLRSAEQVADITDAYLQALGLTAADSEKLRELPAAELMRAQAKVEANLRSWPHFFPVADTLFGGQPRATFTSGKGNMVPLIIGTNRDEWNLFAVANVAEWQKPLDDAELITRVARKLPAGSGEAAANLADVYRTSRRERGLPHSNRALLRAIDGDLRFRIPSLRFLELYQTLTPDTFSYLFTYESPAMRGELGACHALELPFVFGSYGAPNQERFVGAGEAVVSLSHTMTTLWTGFARSGEPSSAQVASWPRYEPSHRKTLELGATTQLVDDSFGDERRVWEGLI